MAIADEFGGLFQSLVSLIRTSAQVNAQDVGFFRALDKSLKTKSEQQSQRILDLVNRLIGEVAGDSLKFSSLQDLENHWKSVDSIFDTLLDRVDAGLVADSSSSNDLPPSRASTPSVGVVFHDKNVEKPQLRFSSPIDNSVGPFKPLLAEKVHAIKGLNESLEIQAPDQDHEGPWYEQPYKTEIEQSPYPKHIYTASEPVEPAVWEDTPFTFVDKPKQLRKVISKLLKVKEFAVDLEHHDYRSYLGLVSLMQISTATEDWIIDTLALRTELQALNEVFTDPSIVKVFHGAQHDIIWLQRDLGIYIVGLFDTYHASRALGLGKHSLSFLLESIVGFKADKQYQLADWRIRPLTQEMTDYARADTHFLLYIYQTLRNRLIESDKLEPVLEQSRITAGLRFEKPEYNAEPGWINLSIKHKLNPAQERILSKLYNWRDAEARNVDESPRFIMPNSFLISLALTSPTSASSVVSVGRDVTLFTRNNAVELAALIKTATEEPIPSQSATDKKLAATAAALNAARAEIAKESLANVTSRSSSLLATSAQPSEYLFSADSVEEAKTLRLDSPYLFTPVPSHVRKSAAKQASKVYLGVLHMDDLKIVQDAAEKAEEVAAQEAEISVKKEEPKAKIEEPDVEVEPVQTGKRKRKINIVETIDDVEEKAELPKPKRVASDSPAFDFAGSKPIFEEKSESSSFTRFKDNITGPLGARNKKRNGKAQSKTFKR